MQNEMKNVKVVSRFFTNYSARVEKDNQLKIAAKAGRKNVQVVIEDAYIMYMRRGWFRSKIVKIGRPVPGQKILVVYYNASAARVENPKSINMVKPVKRTIELKFEKRTETVSVGAAKEKTILIELALLNNTHIVRRHSKIIAFRRAHNIVLAA